MIFFSPAKINLGLRITRKREDGYHELESVFYPIPLFDILEIHPNAAKYEYVHTGIPIDCALEDNTCYKAYTLLVKDFPHLPSIYLHHHKTIPTGMGLGAGSANAVALLEALNNLYNLALTQEQLLTYAKKIGSDCAFFVYHKPAYVSGRGDLIEPIEIDLSSYQLLFLLPKYISISTKWAYKHVIPRKLSCNLLSIFSSPISEWRHQLQNDFEVSVFEHFPLLREAKKKLYEQGAFYASMSGSGSSIYALFPKDWTLMDMDAEGTFERDFDLKLLPSVL